MQLKGVFTLAADESPDALEYLPMDGSADEFVRLDQCPGDVQKVVVSLCEASGALPIGVLVDLSAEPEPQS